jgi:hypothetical protein
MELTAWLPENDYHECFASFTKSSSPCLKLRVKKQKENQSNAFFFWAKKVAILEQAEIAKRGSFSDMEFLLRRSSGFKTRKRTKYRSRPLTVRFNPCLTKRGSTKARRTWACLLALRRCSPHAWTGSVGWASWLVSREPARHHWQCNGRWMPRKRTRTRW